MLRTRSSLNTNDCYKSQVHPLFDAHAARLVLYARQWLPRDAAEDVTQESFIHLMAQKSPPGNPRAWLYTAVRNAAMSDRRSESRRARREVNAARTRANLFAENVKSPLAAEEAAAALTWLVDDLRETMTLRIWGDLTFQEIAAVTGVPLSTVHYRYQSALAALKNRLEKPCRINP